MQVLSDIMIGAICYKVTDNCTAKLYLVGTNSFVDWNKPNSTVFGELITTYEIKAEYIAKYKEKFKDDKPVITIAKSIGNEYSIRLVETKRYMLKMDCDGDEKAELPRFQNEGNKFLNLEEDENAVTFQFVNYLGRTKVTFANGLVFQFEVVPDKMDYENDYILLTEALAEHCSSLLLEFSGTTSNLFKQSGVEQQTLLEQFVFLRRFCYAQNLRSLFESIKRRPDRTLCEEEEFKPLGLGRPSKKFYTNPFSYSKRWEIIGNENTTQIYLPQEVAVTRKYDSLDTPANRFVKFALQKFDAVCTELAALLGNNEQSKQVECLIEAKLIHETINDIFQDSFFDEVGVLDIMPQNNQVLLKREGYAQIFSAYSMIDLALQLDWKGKDDIYEGESKNVALLYEYWLFFELFKIIKSIDGCEMVNTNDSPFLKKNEDGITISLKEGKNSCQSFCIGKFGLKVNLYYNRTFSKSDFLSSRYEGSYSRSFRPDYTLAVFPDLYTKGQKNGEEEAIKDGAVSYIHFDAKYRVTDLTKLIGESIKTQNEEQELEEEKEDSVKNTYKRGDLLKMHTYNDAIRRTIGSYVLYPGSSDSSYQNNKAFRLYDEILPGVGAFAIKPSIAVQGESELKSFILELIESRAARNTRLYRMNHYTEMVIKEPTVTVFDNTQAVLGNTGKVNVQNDKLCALGYIRAGNENDYYHFLKEKELLKNGSVFLFYFYAIKSKQVYSHHNDIFNTAYFRFYKNRISDNDTYKLEPVLCSVISNELLSKADLVKALKDIGYETDEQKHYADFYYVLKVRVINDNYKTDEFKTSFINSKNGNDTFSPHTPKVMLMSDLAGSDQQ